jgi:hypothetical protein
MFKFFLGFWNRRIHKCFCFLLLGLSACRTATPLPKANLADPSWQVRQGQAAWRSTRSAPEIAGEILLATKPDGEAIIQFTKTPFPFVIAQRTTNAWQIEVPAQNKTYRFAGNPPARLIWFQLPRAVFDEPLQKPWRWNESGDTWRLENASTGESLEGYFSK